jgi:D-glycero-alpha-D-manno-heptose 1-phosphate guanylyltransferase
MEAIILTGGVPLKAPSAEGEVLRPMTLIHGRPFLSYVLEFWAKQGVDRFIISLLPTSEMIRAYFGARFRGVDLEYVYEKRNFGSGGSVLVCSQRILDSKFLVLSGTSFVEVPLKELKTLHSKKGADLTLIATQASSNETGIYLDVASNGKVTSLYQDATEFKGKKKLNAGSYIFEKAAFDDLPFERGDSIDLERTLLPYLLKRGDEIYAFNASSPFVDISGPGHHQIAMDTLLALSQKAA